MAEALKVAIDLLHMPSRVRLVRAEPLPAGTLTLLRIAAGEEAEIADAAATLDRPRQVIQDAASFFIEQILFTPNSDSYRVLGAAPQSTNTELRRNMALLLRWVHPDLDKHGSRASFATRVSQAWDDLKTTERREAYDARLPSPKGKSRRSRFGKSAVPGNTSNRAAGPAGRLQGSRAGDAEGRWAGFFRRTLSFLFPRS